MTTYKSKHIDFSKKDFSTAELALIQKEIEILKLKYPKHIPIVVNVNDKTKDLSLTKNKFLVSGDLTLGAFNHIIRRRLGIKLSPSTGIFLFVDNTLYSNTTQLSTLYQTHVDQNTGILFITLCKENTFG